LLQKSLATRFTFGVPSRIESGFRLTSFEVSLS